MHPTIQEHILLLLWASGTTRSQIPCPSFKKRSRFRKPPRLVAYSTFSYSEYHKASRQKAFHHLASVHPMLLYLGRINPTDRCIKRRRHILVGECNGPLGQQAYGTCVTGTFYRGDCTHPFDEWVRVLSRLSTPESPNF